MRLDPYGFRLLLRFILFSIVFLNYSNAQNEVDINGVPEPTESPDTFQYRTGKLNQFKGFYTPRPFFQQNYDTSYSSIWATWSAWSFCSDGVQVRVRACNTVRGFSCLGPNQERRPCETFTTKPAQLPALHEQDYDAIDPYIEDRREALKQLYPDYGQKEVRPAIKLKEIRRKPARRPAIIAHDSDFAIQSPDGRTNFEVVGRRALAGQISCGYGQCSSGVAAPPKELVNFNSGGPAQPPGMTPEKLYGESKNPYDENQNESKKKKKKAKIRGDITEDINKEDLEEHIEKAVEIVQETTPTEDLEVSEIPSPETKVQEQVAPTEEESEYFNDRETNVDYDEDYGKNPSTDTPSENEKTDSTELTYPPTRRIKLVTAPPKRTKLKKLGKKRNREDLDKKTSPVIQELHIVEIVQPKITYTPNFSSVADPETLNKNGQNHAVSAVPLPAEIEGPIVELAGNTNDIYDDEKVDVHDKGVIYPKFHKKTKDSEKVIIEGPELGEGSEEEKQKFREAMAEKSKLHDGEVVFEKKPMTSDTAKAIEWLLSNMSKAAELQEQQSKNTINQQLNQVLNANIDAMNQAEDSKKDSLHSGEAVIPRPHKAGSGDYSPRQLPRIRGTKIFRSTEKVIQYDDSDVKRKGAKIFTHLTTTFQDKNESVPNGKFEVLNHTPHLNKSSFSDSSRTTEAPQTPVHSGQINGELKFNTFRETTPFEATTTEKTTETLKLLENPIENHKDTIEISEITDSPETFPFTQKTYYISAETHETTYPPANENIESEISKLRNEMKIMESELNALKKQENSLDIEKSVDGKVDEVTNISPIINPKAYELDLVPKGPKYGSGDLPPIVEKNVGELFIVDESDLKEAEWNEWSDWAECFCGKQIRRRTCNFDSGYNSKGCVGKSYETRECTSSKSCPSLNIKKLRISTSTLPPLRTFYTLAPPGKRRLGANFVLNPLSIAKLSKD